MCANCKQLFGFDEGHGCSANTEKAAQEFARQRRLNEDEWDEYLQLLEKKFGPRPTDPQELSMWKTARHSYMYGPSTEKLNRMRWEAQRGY